MFNDADVTVIDTIMLIVTAFNTLLLYAFLYSSFIELEPGFQTNAQKRDNGRYARSNPCMSWITSTWAEQVYVYAAVEAKGMGWDPVRLCLSTAPGSSLLSIPGWCFRCGDFCWLLCGVLLSNVCLLAIMLVD